MTGIEKIINKIETDCNLSCDDIINKAQAEAQTILNNSQIACAKVSKDTIASINTKCQTEIELATSRAENERKKANLATKINIINEVIDEAVQKLKNLPESEYFKVIKKLITDYAQNGLGTMHLSKKDLSRIPQDFEIIVNEMLKGSEKSVAISTEAVDIDSGFVIIYDDIEQNCSFDSLLNASLDEIKDALYEEIFMRDSV